jgi:transposase
VAGLRSRPIPGPSGERGERALAAAEAILAQPRLSSAPPWTLPRLDELIVHTSPTKDSAAFCRFLEHLKARAQDKPLHLVLDNGPIHKSRMSQVALAAAADWLTIEWLPAYAPELNDIERDWRNMKCHYLAHQTFTDIDSLDWHIFASVISQAPRHGAPRARGVPAHPVR